MNGWKLNANSVLEKLIISILLEGTDTESITGYLCYQLLKANWSTNWSRDFQFQDF